jgi:hypothetical protein
VLLTMPPIRNFRTRLRRRRRATDPMAEYDRLPAPVRAWLAGAILPWSPRSAGRAFAAAFRKTRDQATAIAALDGLEARLIARDLERLWGPTHPGLDHTCQKEPLVAVAASGAGAPNAR